MSQVVRCRAPARKPRYPGETCASTIGLAGDGIVVQVLEERQDPPPGRVVLTCLACGTVYALDLDTRRGVA